MEDPTRVRERVARLAGEGRGELAGSEQRGRRVACGGGSRGRLLGLCDGRLGRVVAEGLKHARERDPIDDAVMDPPDDRGAVAEAVQEVHAPQRLVAIECGGLQPRHERLERGLVAGGGQAVAMHVTLHLKAGVLLPPRHADPNARLHHTLAEAREALDQSLSQQLFDRVPCRCSGEPQDGRDDREVRGAIHAQPG